MPSKGTILACHTFFVTMKVCLRVRLTVTKKHAIYSCWPNKRYKVKMMTQYTMLRLENVIVYQQSILYCFTNDSICIPKCKSYIGFQYRLF